MREHQSSETTARLRQFLDVVKKAKTIIITRHGPPVARLVRAPAAERDRVRHALARMSTLRRTINPGSLEESQAWRDEGHKY